jgi:hypothetical protein
MAEFESPSYVLDLANSINCAHIESAKPNVSFRVLVVPESDLSAASMSATGLLSVDSTSFSVTVETPAGTQEHSWPWESLRDALAARRGT